MNALNKNTENTQDKVKMTVINHSNVKDFKFAQHHPLYSKIFKSTCKENGNPVKWSKIMQARFTPHDQQRMLFKYLYSEENFRCLDLVTESTTRSASAVSTKLPEIEDIPNCYSKPPGITPEKYRSLQKLCDKNLIPPHHHHFYQNIEVMKDTVDSEDE